MSHIVRAECERVESDLLSLRSLIAPASERFCSVETHVKTLLSRVAGFQRVTDTESASIIGGGGSGGGGGGGGSAAGGAGVNDVRVAEQSLAARVSIGVYGARRSGKSHIVGALIGQPDLFTKKMRTKVPLVVMPSRGERSAVCMRLPDGKAIAVGVESVQRAIAERNRNAGNERFAALQARLHVDLDEFLPLSAVRDQDNPSRRQQRQQQALQAAMAKLKQQNKLHQQQQQQQQQQQSGQGNDPAAATIHHTAASLLGIATAGDDLPWCIVDHPPTDRATKMRFSSATITSMSPVEFADDIVLYCVDARAMGTPAEVDVFDSLVHLHPEEKRQLRAASAFIVGGDSAAGGASPSSVASGAGTNSSSDEDDGTDGDDKGRRGGGGGGRSRPASTATPTDAAGGADEVPFVTTAATRRRLLSCTYFLLTHVDAFPDSEVVLSRSERLDLGQAQIYDEGWSATHGQPAPACRTAEFAMRRFGMLAEFVMGCPVAASRVIATSAVGIAHTKAVLECRNCNRKCSDEALAEMFRAEREAAVAHSTNNNSTKSTNPNAIHTWTAAPAANEQDRADLVHRMYNFAEWFLGPKFMHRADRLPFDELRRIVLNFAMHRSSITSGARALDSLLSVLLHSLAAHFLLSVCNTAAEIAESLHGASELGTKVIGAEAHNARESEGVLVREYDWVSRQIDAIQVEARKLPERAALAIEQQLAVFRERWLEELCDVFARKPLEWFKSRQIATVRDVQAALVSYDAFSDQFAAHHRYLFSVMASTSAAAAGAGTGSSASAAMSPASSFRVDRSSHGGSSAALSFTSAASQQQQQQQQQSQQQLGSGSKFIRDNIGSLYEAAMKSRAEKLFEVNTCVAHHLRDEVLHFVRGLAESTAREQEGWLGEFGAFCRLPVGTARTRFTHNKELRVTSAAAAPSAASAAAKGRNGRDDALVLALQQSTSRERIARLTESLEDTAQESERCGPAWLAATANGAEAILRADDNDASDDRGSGVASSSFHIVWEDTRQLNIYCREIVEPVTAAQSELVLLDEAEQQQAIEQQGAIMGRHNNNRNGSSTGMSALQQLHEAKREAQARRELQERNVRALSAQVASDPSKIRHRFIFDAWRLALFSLRLEQVSRFDLEPFIRKIAALTAAAVDAMAAFRTTLAVGIEEHAAIVTELERDQEALDALAEALPDMLASIAEATARYAVAVDAPSADPEVVTLQRRVGMCM